MAARRVGERTGVDTLNVGVRAGNEIKEPIAVGQELRIAMPRFSFGRFNPGQQRRTSAGGADALQTCSTAKKDDPVLTPGSRWSDRVIGGVSEGEWRTAGNFNAFELAAREECQGLAVRRPCGEIPILRTGQRTCNQRVQRS